MMRRSWFWEITLALLVIGLGLWTGAQWPQSSKMIPVPNPQEAVSTIQTSASSSSSAARDDQSEANLSTRLRPLPPLRPATRWRPLPAADLPLRASFAQLKANADQGDAPAACRLAAELTFCRRVMVMRPRSTGQSALEKAASAHCAGIQAEELVLEYHYLRQAALAGNRSAIEEYVSGFHLRSDLQGNADFLDAYREEAPRLLEAAVQNGSAWALFHAQSAFGLSGYMSLLRPAMGVSYDPSVVTDLQMLDYLVTASHLGRAPQTLAERRRKLREQYASLPPDAFAKREALALSRLQEWFNGELQVQPQNGFGGQYEAYLRPDFNTTCSTHYIADPMNQPAIDWNG